MPDRSELDDTYEQWLETARRTVRDMESDGHAVERVPVDVVALSEWCRERGLPLTGPSRAKYVLQLDR